MDGTGKTTHALNAKRAIENSSRKCEYVEFQYQMSIFMSFFLIRVAWLILGRKRPVERYVHQNRALTWVWLFSSIFDYAFYVPLKNLSRRRVILLCDRYVTDTIVRLQFNGIYSETFSKLLLLIAPRPDLIFHLDAPERIALRRKNEDSLEYYMKQRKMYKVFLAKSRLNYVTIETSEDLERTDKMISYYIESIIDPVKRNS